MNILTRILCIASSASASLLLPACAMYAEPFYSEGGNPASVAFTAYDVGHLRPGVRDHRGADHEDRPGGRSRDDDRNDDHDKNHDKDRNSDDRGRHDHRTDGHPGPRSDRDHGGPPSRPDAGRSHDNDNRGRDSSSRDRDDGDRGDHSRSSKSDDDDHKGGKR